MERWFELRTCADLLRKLDRDLAKLRENPRDADLAFNFFVTAEHMLDWHDPGDAGKRARSRLRERHVVLQVTHHLASGAKHFKVEAKCHESVRGTKRSEGVFNGVFGDVFPRGLWGEDELVVELDNEAERELGSQIGVLELAGMVLECWTEHLTQPADMA